MLDMITDLQSDRMDSQRAELRPSKKLTKESKGTSLPGLRPQQTTSAKPEDDFLDMIARVQVGIAVILHIFKSSLFFVYTPSRHNSSKHLYEFC